MHVDTEATWEVSEQPKRYKSACYVCNEAFDPCALRLRPAGTHRTRLMHPSCAAGMAITLEKVVNAHTLSSEAAARLRSQLEHSHRASPHPGDTPQCTHPSTAEIKHLIQFDSVSWDRCLECVPCIRHVPEHWASGVWEARAAVARTIIQSYEQGDRQTFERAWKLFSLFDSLLLCAVAKRRGGRRGQGRGAVALNTLISARLRAFWSGSWLQLLLEADSARLPTRAAPPEQSEDARAARNVRTVQSLVANKAVSKAISRVSSSATFACGPDVCARLHGKFTNGHPPQNLEFPRPSAEVVAELESHIEEQLWHLPPMLSAGPTGTLYEHIRATNVAPAGPALLAKVMAMLLTGAAPAEAVRVHRSARISPINKVDALGNPTGDIRPLAAGSVHWRVAMRGWARMFRTEAAEATAPSQYGVGFPGSCVSLRHDLLAEWCFDPDRVLLGIDLENMHNTISTERLVSQVAHRIPRMAELLSWIRVPRTHVYVDEQGERHTIDATDGLDQGCPASNLLAPIAIAEAHERLREVGSVFGQQDDTYILCPHDILPTLCSELSNIFRSAGPRVNYSKCFVAASVPCDTGATGISVTAAPRVLKLPMPIPRRGEPLVFDSAPAVQAVAKREQLLDSIAQMRQHGLRSQTAFLLARVATDGDINYLCQSLPIPHVSAQSLDDALLNSVLGILGIDRADDFGSPGRWFIPWRDGGMGLSSVTHCADALLAASWLPALERAASRHALPSPHSVLERIPMLMPLFDTTAASLVAKGASNIKSTDDLLQLPQDSNLAASWRLDACARTISDFDCGASIDAVVTRKESGGTGAGAWLLAPRNPKHWLSDQAFVTSVRARMYLPIFQSTGECMHSTRPRPDRPLHRCPCQRDRHGRHAFHCNLGGGILRRHNAMRDMAADMVMECTELPATIEQHDQALGDDRRPDLRHQNWRGETVHIDVAIVSPHAQSVRGDPRQLRPGGLVASHEALKKRKYPELRLIPAVSSHLGRPGADLVTWIRSLCRDTDPAQRSDRISSLWQTWSTTLMHWNSHILATAGPLMPP